jgi:hypothetical protein
MTLDEFRQSLTAIEPPTGLTHALAGLWWDANGDWTRAHESAQQDKGMEGSWVHAYLHRKEGDQGNAAYWYNRAGKPVCREPLNAEWLAIVKGSSREPSGFHVSLFVQLMMRTADLSSQVIGTICSI